MPVHSVSLSDYVYEELLHQFQTGKYSPGSRLPGELRLAQEFNVSRPIVRGALSRLRDDGYVVSKKGSGSYLVRVDSASISMLVHVHELSDLLLAFDYRAGLEAAIAAKAAMAATELDKRNIENTYRANCKRTASRYLDHLTHDFEFHCAIAEATHNPFYCQAFKEMQKTILQGIDCCSGLLQKSRMTYRPKDNEHAVILQAISRKDAVLASAAMMNHVYASGARMKQLLIGARTEDALGE